MRLRDLIPLSFKALVINKSRTVLTMLGIIIGIASVILMIGVGQAAQNYLLSQVASFGSDQVFIRAGSGDVSRGGPPSAATKQTLTIGDFKKLKALTWPKAVDGIIISRDLVSYAGQDRLTSVTGASPDDVIVFNATVESGRFLTPEDIDSRSRVVVLGRKIQELLFGQENPIGRTMKIGKQPFKVIGVMSPAGTRFFDDADDQVFIPFTAAMDLYNKNRLSFIAIKAGDVKISDAKDLIRVTLREAHNLDNPEGILSKDDFFVAAQEDAVRNIQTIGGILQILLASIASISLVVAGVGIMNIMYVTVTERTREIGLRKAIGAKPDDILGQFLLEAVILTVVAGCIGMTIGISINWLAIQIISSFQTGWTFTVPWFGALIGFSVSAVIGIIFGFFPARKAAHLNPIEALRYE